MAKETNPQDFFKTASQQSIVKATLVSNYVAGWARIVIKDRVRRQQSALAYYIDLCSGPGIYDDGTPSTPMRIIEGLLGDQTVCENLMLRFNDQDKEIIGRLKKNLESHPYLREKFKQEWKCSDHDAEAPFITKFFANNATNDKRPVLVFLDPFGYKQLDRGLLQAILATPQSDLIFFFNYKRVNAALGNEAFESNMDKIFGHVRVQRIKTQLEHMPAGAREPFILAQLEEALREIGGTYVTPFLIAADDSEQTSHYIVGVSKHPKGYELAKKVWTNQTVMAAKTSTPWGYDPPSILRAQQGGLFEAPPDPIGDLANMLARTFAGVQKAFGEVYSMHHPTSKHTEPDYREAVRKLLTDGRAVAQYPNGAPPKVISGRFAIPPVLLISFAPFS